MIAAIMRTRRHGCRNHVVARRRPVPAADRFPPHEPHHGPLLLLLLLLLLPPPPPAIVTHRSHARLPRSTRSRT